MVPAINGTLSQPLIPHESLEDYIKSGFDEEADCIRFLKSDGAKNIPASGDNGLAHVLFTALDLKKKAVAEAILKHPNAKNLSGLDLGFALKNIIDSLELLDLFNLISKHPNAKDISINVLLKLENLSGEKTERIRTVLQHAKSLQRKRIFTALFILLSIMVIAVLVLFRKKHKFGR